MQFIHVGVHPSFIHGLVGDVIWKACWGERHTDITPQHAFPYKLLNVVRHAVEVLRIEQTEEQRGEGKKKLEHLQLEPSNRRVRGGPY